MSFTDAANPRFFQESPQKFWFFYGHRYNIYRKTEPHGGFKNLLEIGNTHMNGNYFVFTSNVDNHFQRAGFPDDKIVECHGSIMHFQCSFCWDIYEADVDSVDICIDKFEAKSIPSCPKCKRAVRPNILMFGDWDWLGERPEEQQERFKEWA